MAGPRNRSLFGAYYDGHTRHGHTIVALFSECHQFHSHSMVGVLNGHPSYEVACLPSPIAFRTHLE